MLLNIGEKVSIKFNGKYIEVDKGGKLDVRDFDITTGQQKPMSEAVPIVEKRILNKYPGQFKVVATVDDVKIDEKYRKEISDLEKQVGALSKELAELKEVNQKNSKVISEQAEQINGFGAKEKSFRDQISTLKAQMKEAQEEHDAQVMRLTGGRKVK